MYDKILLPTDGSEAAESAVEHAYELASHYDAELHVLHVIVPNNATVVGAGTIQNSLEERAQRAVNPIAEEAEAQDIDVTTAIETGTAHRQITAYANTNEIDVIVMSTHGRSGFERILLGSVTERVIRLSDVPVIAIPRT